jgi:hypothetical protein
MNTATYNPEEVLFNNYEKKLSFDDLIKLIDKHKIGIVSSNEIYCKLRLMYDIEFNFSIVENPIFSVIETDMYILISNEKWILKFFRKMRYTEIIIK